MIEIEDEEAAEHFVTEEEWEGVFNTLHLKFAEDDLYYFIDPYEHSHTDPVKASLCRKFHRYLPRLERFCPSLSETAESFNGICGVRM